MMSSCHDDTSTENKELGRTIFMYFPYSGYSNNLYRNILQNINDVESAIAANHGLGDNNLVYFVARNATQSHLINVTFEKGKIHRDTLKAYLRPEVTTVSGISSILMDVKNLVPAQRYAMVIGSHGEGWLPAHNDFAAKGSRYFGSGTIGHQTDVVTFAEALGNCKIHLDYLLMDQCYMACIENAYDLRNVCDYFIASSTEMMNYGMPYKRIFSSLLFSEPDYEDVCRQYLDFYNNYVDDGESMPYGTLSVTDCSHIEEVAQYMNIVNSYITQPLLYSEILNIQDLDAAHHDPTIYFDLGDYVDNLPADNGVKEEFKSLLRKAIPYKANTKNIFSYSPRKVVEVKSFCGLSVSDPTINEEAISAKRETSWWKATHLQ